MRDHKIIAYEPGGARVQCAVTGADIGYVVQGFDHWAAYAPVTHQLNRLSTGHRTRSDAAQAVADHHHTRIRHQAAS